MRLTSLSQQVTVTLIALCIVVGAYFIFTLVRTHNDSYPELAEIEARHLQTFDEFNSYFVALAKKKTAVYAFSVLKFAHIPPTVDIHRLGHSIGYVHFEQKGLAGIRDCTTDFRNACEHAIVVQALILSGTHALEDVAKVCSEGPGGISAYVHCFHGVGHGLMAYLNYDYETAVTTCKQVYDFAVVFNPDVTTKALWYECIGGATMELTQGEHDQVAWERAKKIYMPESDILMPCDADFMPLELRPMCYSYLKPRFLEAAGATRGTPSPHEYPAALAYCKKIPIDEPDSRDGCYAGFGAAFAYFANGDARTLEHMSDAELKDVHLWCSFADDAHGQLACTLSALDVIFWGGQSDSPASISFCNLAPNSEIRLRCFASLIETARYSYGSVSKLQAFCAQLPEEHRMKCEATTAPSYGS